MLEAFSLFILLVLTALLCLVYLLIVRTWNYFSDQNVKFVRGMPLLGSTYRSVMGLEPAAISYRRCYEQFPKEKFIGIYDIGGQPSYLIRDVDLIKQLMVTDFDYFSDHKASFANDNDLFAHTLFGKRGSTWRRMRCTISPAFSGSRMRMMHQLMIKSTEQFIDALRETDKTAKIFDSRDLFSRFANDIIATTAFGIEMDSMRDDGDSEFLKIGRSMSEFRYVDGLKFLATLSFPKLVKFFDIRLTQEKNAQFMRRIVRQNVDSRQKYNISRNDMIDLLIKARQNDLEHDERRDDGSVGYAAVEESMVGKSKEKIENWSEDDMVAQCLIFLIGGLSTLSGTASFMFHELSLNPDIQEKLYREIITVKNELNGASLTYEMLAKLKYLDMVVSETLRRWCPIAFVERKCTRPYTLDNGNGQSVQLRVGDGIFVPIYGIHMDEKYFPKPMKFDPERFSDTNKPSIKTGTYLPFGIGPRNCIGSRFAIMAIKTLTFHLLSSFVIDRSYKTQDPLKLKPLPLMLDASFYIELRRRVPDRTPYKSQVFS